MRAFRQYKRDSVSRLLLLMAMGVFFFQRLVLAQSSAPPDVLGLKLGMSLEQAKAGLEKYHPGIWSVTYYLTEDRKWWWGFGIAPQIDAGRNPRSKVKYPFHDAAIKVPVHIGAGYFEKVYTETPDIVAVGDKAPIGQYSGEFFSLYFTPPDSGSKLYAIVRQRVYYSNPFRPLGDYAKAGVKMPGVADLERSLAGKYGEPAARDKQDRYVSLVWSYDGGQGDLARCESHFEGEDGQENPAATFGAPRGPVDRAPNTFYSLKKRENITLRAMRGAFEGKDFYNVDFSGSSSDLDEDVNKFAGEIVPQILSNKGYPVRRTVPDQSYRGCGVQLHAVIMPTQTPGLNRKTTPTDVAWAMTISLSDQNALFVDDGVLAYMKAEVAKPAESGPKPPPKKEVF